MPTKNVVIFGTMTWAEEPGDVNRPAFPTHPIAPGGTTPPWGIEVPPGIWGPNDPRPGYGLPGGPGRPPLGTWGPGDPFPGYGPPGNQPGVGYPGFPTPPIVIVGDGGVVAPPAAGVPVEGTLTFYEGKGYVFKLAKDDAPEEPDAAPKA